MQWFAPEQMEDEASARAILGAEARRSAGLGLLLSTRAVGRQASRDSDGLGAVAASKNENARQASEARRLSPPVRARQ